MSLTIMLKDVGKRIKKAKGNKKIVLFLGMLLASIIGVVGAAVYNSMYMQSDVGVESALVLLCY